MYMCEEDEDEEDSSSFMPSVVPDTAYNGVCRRGGF